VKKGDYEREEGGFKYKKAPPKEIEKTLKKKKLWQTGGELGE